MTITDKIDIINKLSEEDFFGMFETLVKNQKFENVKRSKNSVICDQKIMGHVTVCLFVLFRQRLSGITSDEVESVYKKIESLQNQFSANSVFCRFFANNF